jgi:hypothetical protein
VNEWTPPEPQKVIELWNKADTYLLKERRDYWMNASYYAGLQWIWWDYTRNIVQELDYNTDYEKFTRITVDKFGPRVTNLVARMTRSPLVWEVEPSGIDDSNLRRQRLQEQLLLSESYEQHWDDIREESLLQTLFGGVAAISVDWDPDLGPTAAIDPVTNIAIPTGGVSITPLCISEFTLEPGSADEFASRYWIKCVAMPPEQVKEKYKLDWLPAPDAEAALSSRHRTLLTRRPQGQPPRLTLVYCYYERPTETTPGCVIHVVNGKQVYGYGDGGAGWPFPFTHLNIALGKQRRIPRTWVGHTLLSPARDIQYAYNRARSTILEHMRKAANARLMVPVGSIEDSDTVTTDPADILEYNAEIGEPHWQMAPDVPRWISNEATQLEMEMDDIFFTHSVSRGQAPGDRNSGLALSVLAEKDDTPLGPMARNQSQLWSRVGKMTLQLYRAYAEQSGMVRTQTLTTPQGNTIQFAWSADDIDDNPQVKVPLDATAPRSKIATQSVLTSLADRFPQAFANADPLALARMLDLPDPKGYLATMDADIAKAEWENGLLMQATPVMPATFDDHAKHIAQHNKERKTAAYELASADVRQAIDLHIQAHETLAAEEAAQQLQLMQQMPGAQALPQANEPPGSMVPQPQLGAAGPQEMMPQ